MIVQTRLCHIARDVYRTLTIAPDNYERNREMLVGDLHAAMHAVRELERIIQLNEEAKRPD